MAVGVSTLPGKEEGKSCGGVDLIVNKNFPSGSLFYEIFLLSLTPSFSPICASISIIFISPIIGYCQYRYISSSSPGGGRQNFR